MIEEEEIKIEENKEYIIDLKFLDTKINIKINNDFVTFIKDICKIIKISEEDINSVNVFYLDSDEDKINISNEGDYEIFFAQVKDNTVKGIELEIKENTNLNVDVCLANFFNYIEQNEKNIKKKNEDEYKNNNEIKNEIKINKINFEDEENENNIIQINEGKENNNGEFKIIENYFNDKNKFEIFECYCSSCNESPIYEVLYFCPECDICLCSNCNENTKNHQHIILRIDSNEELMKTIDDYFGNDDEDINMNDNNNNKNDKIKDKISKISNFFPNVLQKLSKSRLSRVNKKEKKIRKNK